MDPRTNQFKDNQTQEEKDASQIVGYKRGLIFFWILFGICLAIGGGCFAFGIVKLATILGDENASIAGPIMFVVGGGIMFLVSMLCLGLAISLTSNYSKAKHHIARKIYEDQ